MNRYHTHFFAVQCLWAHYLSRSRIEWGISRNSHHDVDFLLQIIFIGTHVLLLTSTEMVVHQEKGQLTVATVAPRWGTGVHGLRVACLFLSLISPYEDLPGTHQYLLTAWNAFWSVGFIIIVKGVRLLHHILLHVADRTSLKLYP